MTADLPPIPLFVAPHYHGSRDPEVVWNPKLQCWFIYYTASRALMDPGRNMLAGTPIGVASSTDWREWTFLGYCSFDGQDAKPDADRTYWAPALIVHEDCLHMYVQHRGPNDLFRGGGSDSLHHHTALLDDPLTWHHEGAILNDKGGMDAGVFKAGDSWLMTYRSHAINGCDSFFATSSDLYHWTPQGLIPGDVNDKSIHGLGYQEGQYPFRWRETNWLLTDPFGYGAGLALYQADDAIHWTYIGRILGEPGTHSTDASHARHPSVAVIEERAFIFYHIEPYRDYSITPLENAPPQTRRTYVQMAELIFDGCAARTLRPGAFALPSRNAIIKGPGI